MRAPLLYLSIPRRRATSLLSRLSSAPYPVSGLGLMNAALRQINVGPSGKTILCIPEALTVTENSALHHGLAENVRCHGSSSVRVTSIKEMPATKALK
jgi:hypothetical protein